MENFQELEYKYNANGVGLLEFQKLMAQLGFLREISVSSWDIYYTCGEPDSFSRFRFDSKRPELTKKTKTISSNNWVRQEVDLPLDPARVSESVVSKYLEMEGYKENFRIYKSCFIYWQEDLNFVYYIVYDENLREKGRFIEVEVNKEAVTRLDNCSCEEESGAIAALNRGEEVLATLGITSRNRLKRSLFEIFRKGD